MDYEAIISSSALQDIRPKKEKKKELYKMIEDSIMYDDSFGRDSRIIMHMHGPGV